MVSCGRFVNSCQFPMIENTDLSVIFNRMKCTMTVDINWLPLANRQYMIIVHIYIYICTYCTFIQFYIYIYIYSFFIYLIMVNNIHVNRIDPIDNTFLGLISVCVFGTSHPGLNPREISTQMQHRCWKTTGCSADA